MAAIDYLNKIRELKRPEYTSQYGGIIGDIMGKIVNRQPFSYDFNADPIFHQYKDYYTKAGNEASMNAVANASALTGGYGNSYAVTAGAQANQQALSGLSNIIPQLYSAAQKKYDSDLNALYADYDLYNNAEQDNYNKYRDALGDYESERAYLTNMYNTELAQENYLAEKAAAQAAADQQYALQLAKLNSSSSKSSGKKDKDNTPTGTINPATQSALVGAAMGMVGAKNLSTNNKSVSDSKANVPFVVQKGIDVYNGSKDINQVEKMLEAQITKGAMTENEALAALDKIMKNIH